MIKEFSRLEMWVSKKKISMTENNKEKFFIVKISNSNVINVDDISSAAITTFHPNEEDREESINKLIEYLKENEIELFAVIHKGHIIKDLIKPANISLKKFIYEE